MTDRVLTKTREYDVRGWVRKVCTGAVYICRLPPSSPVHINAFTYFQNHSLNQFHWTKSEITAMYSADTVFSCACVTWQKYKDFYGVWTKLQESSRSCFIVRSWVDIYLVMQQSKPSGIANVIKTDEQKSYWGKGPSCLGAGIKGVGDTVVVSRGSEV